MATVVPSKLRLLFVLLLCNVFTSILHYVDNILFFAQYPEPTWLNPCIVDMFWFVMTPFAILGYWYHLQRWTSAGTVALAIYSIMNSFTLGHYLISPPWEVSLKINAFILLEAIAALGLLVYAFQLQARVKAVA